MSHNETIRRILSELSKKTLGSYVKKSSNDITKKHHELKGRPVWNNADHKRADKDKSKLTKRVNFRDKAVDSLSKEETENPIKSWMKKIFTTEELEIIEARHSKGGGAKGSSKMDSRVGKVGAGGQDTEGDDHPINIMRKAIDLGRPVKLSHQKGGHTMIEPHVAHKLLTTYAGHKTAAHKTQMINSIWHSPEGFKAAAAGKPLEGPKKRGISLGGSKLIGGIREATKQDKKKEKKKIGPKFINCPNCNAKNKPHRENCIDCDHDLDQ